MSIFLYRLRIYSAYERGDFNKIEIRWGDKGKSEGRNHNLGITIGNLHEKCQFLPENVLYSAVFGVNYPIPLPNHWLVGTVRKNASICTFSG